MVRVLHVISSVHPRYGGPSTAIGELASMMRAHLDIRCSLVIGAAHDDEAMAVERLARLFEAVVRCRRPQMDVFGFSPTYTRRVGKLIGEADVVHVHSMWNWACYWGARQATAARKPVLLRTASSMDRFDLQKKAAAKKLLGPLFLRPLFSSPNLVHCTSTREASNLETYGGDAKRIVMPLPVHGGGEVLPAERAAARLKLGLPLDADVVLFMSRIDYKKGLELLLPALDRLSAKNPRLHFLLAGRGDPSFEQKFEQWFGQSKIKDRTSRLGFVEGAQKRAALCASDVFVLPSMNENFGISVVEALLAGIPAVISRGVYISDDLDSSEAVVVAPRAVEAVADAIARLLISVKADPELRRKARDLATGLYSPEVLADKYAAIYRRLATQDAAK